MAQIANSFLLAALGDARRWGECGGWFSLGGETASGVVCRLGAGGPSNSRVVLRSLSLTGSHSLGVSLGDGSSWLKGQWGHDSGRDGPKKSRLFFALLCR